MVATPAPVQATKTTLYQQGTFVERWWEMMKRITRSCQLSWRRRRFKIHDAERQLCSGCRTDLVRLVQKLDSCCGGGPDNVP